MTNEQYALQIETMEKHLVDPRQRISDFGVPNGYGGGSDQETYANPLQKRDRFIPFALKKYLDNDNGGDEGNCMYRDSMKSLNKFQAIGTHNLLFINHHAETRDIVNQNTERGKSLLYSMHRVIAIFKGVCDTLVQQNNMLHLLDPTSTHDNLKRFVPAYHYAMTDQSALSPFQRSITYMAAYYQERNLRRWKDQCYAEIEVLIGTDRDNQTNYAEKPSDEGGGNMTNTPANKSKRMMCAKLSSICPVVERFHTRAWTQICSIGDSIYEIFQRNNCERWLDFTSGQNMSMPLTHYFACSTGSSSIPQLERNRFKRTFRDGILDVEIPETHGAVKTEPILVCFSDQEDWDRNVSTSFVACKFFNSPLSPHVASYTHWWFIPTPHLSKTYDHQRLSVTVQCAFAAMKGKLQAPLNKNDHWETILLVIGVALGGKSVNGNAAKNIYESRDVGIIANNMERQFGLMGLHDMYLNICFEVRSNFSMPETTLQCIASGEDIGVAVKNKAPLMIHWDVPMMLIGNEMGGWVDVGGSIVRRIFSVDYKFKVTDPDPNLGAKIDANMGNIILKEHMAYKSLCSYSDGQSVWKILPHYFIDNQTRTAISTNPVMAFVKTSQRVYFEPLNRDYYMAMGEFVTFFKLYCGEHGTKLISVNAIETNLQAQGCDVLHVREAIQKKLLNLDREFAMQVPIDEKVIFGVCLRASFDSYTRDVEGVRLANDKAQDVDENDPEREQDEIDRKHFNSISDNVVHNNNMNNMVSVAGQPVEPDDSDDIRGVWLHRDLKPQSTNTLFKLGGKDEIIQNDFSGFFSKLKPPTRNHFIDRRQASALPPHLAKLARRYHVEAHN